MAGGPVARSEPRRVHRAGRSALLVDCRDIDDVLALHSELSSNPLPEQLELVPAATTLLVRFRSPLAADTARGFSRDLSARSGTDTDTGSSHEVRIPIRYDGEDLGDVAARLGISTDEVIARHSGEAWTAAFSGFSPGFAYLVRADSGDPMNLSVPRRDSPRTRVPAGSVALAGDFSAVYPSASPGGWQLIGSTDARVWDLGQEVPALIIPGTVVRFLPERDSVELQESADSATTSARASTPGSSPRDASLDAEDAAALRIDAPGLATLVQDAGRQGHTDWGVSPSGWADPAAAQAANRLVGNDPRAGVLENTAGGLSVTALRDMVLAVTGGRAELTVQGPTGRFPVPRDRPFALLKDHRLAIGPTTRGLRTYVGARGGIVVEPVLGSTSTDTLSKLGPEPLAKGDVLPVGPEPHRAVAPYLPPVDLPDPEEVTDVHVSPGPRIDWFTDESLTTTEDTVWTITEESNRVGVRLARLSEDAQPLPSTLVRTPQARGRELPSEGIVAGAVQVPPNGNPVVFMSDHPVTGGYPVMGVVEPEGLRLLAQAAPGQRIRLVVDTKD